MNSILGTNTYVKISALDVRMARLEILYPHPALKLIESKEEYLVITDLHIGFEHRFNIKGFNIRASTEKMLSVLTKLIQQHRLDKLLILGDIKSGFSKVSREEWQHIPSFMEQLTSLVEVIVIIGNHDGELTPLLPREVKLGSKEIIIGDTGFLHGHAHPSPKLIDVKRLVMGHVHPTYSRWGSPLSGRPVWLTFRTPKRLILEKSGNDHLLEVWVMPSFNTELSTIGLTVLRGQIISPILRKIKDINEALIITLDGSIIGDAESVKYVL